MRFILLTLLILCVAAEPTCDCACDYQELGRGTWSLLHEMVKVTPNERLQASFVSFMWSLADLYPCGECRGHLTEYLYNHPPVLDPTWVCELHNDVNRRLGKDQQPCWDI